MNEPATPQERAALQESPMPSHWLRDLKDILALDPVTEAGVRNLIYDRYPDSGWADEYRFSLWNASCYLVRNSEEIERYGWAVLDEKCSIIKDAFLVALYEPFLTCPLERMHLLEFPVEGMSARAAAITASLSSES